MSEQPELLEKKTERLEGVDFFGMVKGKKKLYVVKLQFKEKPLPENVYLEEVGLESKGIDGVVKAEFDYNYDMELGTVTVWCEVTDWPANMVFTAAVVGERFV